MAAFFRVLGHVVFGLVLLGGAAWTVAALTFHLAGWIRIAALAAVAVLLLVAVMARMRSRYAGWVVAGTGVVATAFWYQTIVPRDDRDWSIEFDRRVKAVVDGDIVTLSDIRDFQWQSATEADPAWITRSYDLSQLTRVDMLTSVWGNPNIAHLLVSFGFADGAHISFSVETRREADETFNEIGGFIRQFELILIAATEEDVIRLRTNLRQEDVRLYPVSLNAEQRRQMFMSYVDLAMRLDDRPEFYNTLTANCTTVVYQLAKVLQPDLPVDWRLVYSAHLPQYLAELGVLGIEGDRETRDRVALINAKAQAADPDDFSAAIRRP